MVNPRGIGPGSMNPPVVCEAEIQSSAANYR
jgi:hypothetical protein